MGTILLGLGNDQENADANSSPGNISFNLEDTGGGGSKGYQATGNGTATSIHVQTRSDFSGGQGIKLGVYDESDNTLLDEVEVTAANNSDISGAINVEITSGDRYFLAFATEGVTRIGKLSTGTWKRGSFAGTYATQMASDITGYGGTAGADGEIAVWLEGTEDGGGSSALPGFKNRNKFRHMITR